MTSEISQRLKGKQDSSNPTESERRKKNGKMGSLAFTNICNGLQWKQRKGRSISGCEY
jgi:hypothetical protein